MKFNDLLTEEQIDELGIFKNIGKALKGGVQGAVAGYKSSKLRQKGAEHAERIVNNIKSEFEQMVGGGLEPTYQNLIDFLEELGLSELETIPNPAPTTEAVGDLNSLQIDRIIRDAVKKNYARIVAAQKGRSFGKKQAEPEEPESNAGQQAFGNMASQLTAKKEPELEPEQPGAQAFGNMASQLGSKPSAPPVPKSNVPSLGAPTAKTAPSVAPSIDSIVKAYSNLDAAEREELKKQLEILDDQERMSTGTNESKTRVVSKFLGIEL